MTKKEQQILSRYEQATASELWEVYDNYSSAKASAMDYCKRLMARLNGYGLRIWGASCMQFSVAFRYEDEQTGVCKLAYITKDNDRFFEI